MVEIRSNSGRLGNKMFEYAFGRIIAENFKYKLIHDINNVDFNYFNLPSVLEGKEINTPEQMVEGIYSYSPCLLESILTNNEDRKIIVHGYFQKYIYYKNYLDKLRKWFYFDTTAYNYENAIGIHIRKSDFCDTPYDVSDEYFLDILKTESYETIYITSEDPSNNTIKKIQKEFKNVTIFSGDAIATIKAFVCFNRLILSFGTFSWFIGVLSDASKVYMPNKTVNEIDLRINDNDKFIMV